MAAVHCLGTPTWQPWRHVTTLYTFVTQQSILHTYIHTYLNWPLPIGAFQGQWNTTKRRNRTTTTTVKNPNWPEANQLAIYKCSWEVEPGSTTIKFNEWSERVLNPGFPDLKASALTTGPQCLLPLVHTAVVTKHMTQVQQVKIIWTSDDVIKGFR